MQTKVVYSEKCLGYGAWHIESPSRVKGAFEVLRDRGYSFLEPEPASEEDLLLAHSENYLSALKAGLVEDEDSPAFDKIFEYGSLSVGGALLAGRVGGFSLMRPPGHHAGRDGRALGAATQGFCYLNNIAVAVKKSGRKTLILDIDGHHGNGTQEIFRGDAKVVYVSVHESPNYPGTGSRSEGNAVNFALPPDAGSARYLEVLDRALGMVDLAAFEQVAVSCGFDTHKGDLASLGLIVGDYWEIGKRIAMLKKPVFFVLEGGYDGEKVGLDIDSLLRGYEENR